MKNKKLVGLVAGGVTAAYVIARRAQNYSEFYIPPKKGGSKTKKSETKASKPCA